MISFEGVTNWLKERWILEKEAAGIEVVLLPVNELTINFVILKREKGLITVKKKISGLNCIEELVNLLPQGIPAIISITGKGILQKEVRDKESFDGAKIVNAVLPSVNAEDFFYEEGLVNGATEIAIIRKDAAERILERASSLGLNIVATQLSFFALAAIAPFLKDTTEIETSSQKIAFQEGQVSSYEPLPDISTRTDLGKVRTVSLAGEVLDQRLLISYAIAMRLLIWGAAATSGFTTARLTSAISEYRYKEKFKLALLLLLVISFTVVAVNYTLFTYYYEKTMSYSQAITEQTTSYQQYIRLKLITEKKEHYFDKSGWLRVGKLSILADRVAGSIPDSLKLTELSLIPAAEIKAGEVLSFHFSPDTLRITGQCTHPQFLTSWLEELKELRRFKKVAMSRYIYDAKVQKASFQVLVTL